MKKWHITNLSIFFEFANWSKFIKTSFDEKLIFWRLHTGYDSKCFFIETEVMGQVPKHTFLMYQHFKQGDIFIKNWIDGIINHNLAFHVWITILNSNLKIPEILFVVKIIEEICDDFGIRIFNWIIHILKTDISVESCRGIVFITASTDIYWYEE